MQNGGFRRRLAEWEHEVIFESTVADATPVVLLTGASGLSVASGQARIAR
jgi:hypothetical protein